MADTRKPEGLPTAAKAHLAPHILRLGQAVQDTGGSDTTLRQLLHKAIWPDPHVVPYAPLDITKGDLESDPVRSMLEQRKAPGVLVLEGVWLPRQASLCQSFHSLNKAG